MAFEARGKISRAERGIAANSPRGTARQMVEIIKRNVPAQDRRSGTSLLNSLYWLPFRAF